MNREPTIQCCAINGKVCRNGKREDFPIDERTGERFLCNKWVNVRGKNPQSEEVFDNWMCNEYASVLLQMEGAQQSRQAAASSDKAATEVRKGSRIILGLASPEARERLLQADQKVFNLIEQKGA